MKKKIRTMAPLIPCLVVGLCAGSALSGYIPPSQDDLTGNTVQAAETNQKDKDTRETENQETQTDDAAAQGEDVDLASCADGVYEGSGRGFQNGKTTVQVTIKDHKITAINVVSNQDTPSYFSRASALINTIIQKQSTSVDTVSGATYSSRGIIEAVRNALKRAAGQEVSDNFAGSSGTTGGSGSVSIAVSETPQEMADGTYTGSGQGFGGVTTVSVTISGGKIASVEVTEHHDTPEYFFRASVLCGQIVSNNGVSGLDAVSGATFSSRGILEAASNAIAKAAVNNAGSDQSQSDTQQTDTQSGGNQTENTDSGDQDTPADYEKGKFPYADGVYTGTGDGFGGEISVSVAIENHTLRSVTILSADQETDTFFSKARSVLSSVINGQTTDVATVSGATYSSCGILEAIRDALAQAEKITQQGSGNTGQDTDTPGEDGTDDQTDTGSLYKDGIYTASVPVDPGTDGDFDAYTLSLDVTVENGKIVRIENAAGSGDGYTDDDAGFIERALNGTSKKTGVAQQIFQKNGTQDIQAVSGATWSSEAIVSAVDEALKAAR
ncbi:MAG: FMN-binding protein [Lachnospiraceae bacterium]